MVAAKLICVMANRYRLQRTLATGADIYRSDTDEQRDMLTAGGEEHGVDIGIDDLSDPPLPSSQLLHDHYYRSENFCFAVTKWYGCKIDIKRGSRWHNG